MFDEPVARQLGNPFEGPWFLEQVGGARNDRQFATARDHGPCASIQFDDDVATARSSSVRARSVSGIISATSGTISRPAM